MTSIKDDPRPMINKFLTLHASMISLGSWGLILTATLTLLPLSSPILTEFRKAYLAFTSVLFILANSFASFCLSLAYKREKQKKWWNKRSRNLFGKQSIKWFFTRFVVSTLKGHAFCFKMSFILSLLKRCFQMSHFVSYQLSDLPKKN